MTTNTLVIIITVAVVLAATAVYAFATRDLGRHAADPFVILEVHEEYPPPPQTSPAGTANVQDMTPPPPAAATSRPHTHDDGGSQGTQPGAPQGDTGPESEGSGPPVPAPAPLDYATPKFSLNHLLSDTFVGMAIEAGWLQ